MLAMGLLKHNICVSFRTEQFIFSTLQAIDFKIQGLVINFHQKINCSTDWESEKPVLATCGQPSKQFELRYVNAALHTKQNQKTKTHKRKNTKQEAITKVNTKSSDQLTLKGLPITEFSLTCIDIRTKYIYVRMVHIRT